MNRRVFLAAAGVGVLAVAASGRSQDAPSERIMVEGAKFYDLLPEKMRPGDDKVVTLYFSGKGPDSDKMPIRSFGWRGKGTWQGFNQSGEHRILFENNQGLRVEVYLKLVDTDDVARKGMDVYDGDEVEFFGLSMDKRAVTSGTNGLTIRLDRGLFMVTKWGWQHGNEIANKRREFERMERELERLKKKK